MTGSIDVCDLDSARVRRATDQSSLYQYTDGGDETYVGIVYSANDEMRRAVDEVDSRLAPSKQLFQRWYSERESLRDRGMNAIQAHNRAFRLVRYRSRFLDEIDETVFDEYAERIRDGENIVLVCYCGNGRECHRFIVKEKIHERL